MSAHSSFTLRFLAVSSFCLFLTHEALADATPLTSAQLMQMVNSSSVNQQAPVVTQAAPHAPTYTASTPAYTPSGTAITPSPQMAAETAAEPGLAELQVRSSYDATPTSNVNGGTNYGIDTVLYSAPIDEKWRLFAGEYYSHEIEPAGEGSIGYSRSMAGVEYSGSNLLAQLAPTYNHFDGTERVGATGNASWTFNDAWTVGGAAQYFSRDIPLRALNAGITANEYDANAFWTDATARDLHLDANAMTFSDHNIRSAFAGAYTEHLYDSKRFKIDGLINATESQNTKDENRPYYNPDHDAQGMAGARVTQPLYTASNILYSHDLEFTPGAYWQESYGSSFAYNVKYEQRVHLGRTFDGGVGVDYSRQAYDGTQQSDLTFLMDLVERF